MDRTYVSNFLKEIDEIETINHRADKFIEDRTFETYMRRSPENGDSSQQQQLPHLNAIPA
jgi:hypothetical protein